MHISDEDNIDIMSEDYSYLRGEIGQKMFKVARHFLCDECRQKKLGV